MADWVPHRWHGAPEAVAEALRSLGWRAPGEPEGPAMPAFIGGLLPAPGEALRVLDGVAYAVIVAREPLQLPLGLLETGPELSTALVGSF